MELTPEILEQIPNGEIFRVVITKIQRMHDPMNAELTFVCKKGHGYNDWAIYCHHSYETIDYIASNGDKVASKDIIQSIFPCTEEAYLLYRH